MRLLLESLAFLLMAITNGHYAEGWAAWRLPKMDDAGMEKQTRERRVLETVDSVTGCDATLCLEPVKPRLRGLNVLSALVSQATLTDLCNALQQAVDCLQPCAGVGGQGLSLYLNGMVTTVVLLHPILCSEEGVPQLMTAEVQCLTQQSTKQDLEACRREFQSAATSRPEADKCILLEAAKECGKNATLTQCGPNTLEFFNGLMQPFYLGEAIVLECQLI